MCYIDGNGALANDSEMAKYRDYPSEMEAEIKKRLIVFKQDSEESTIQSISSIVRIAAGYYYEACDEQLRKNMGDLSDEEQTRERKIFLKLSDETIKRHLDPGVFPDCFKPERIKEILVHENNAIALSNNNAVLIDASLSDEEEV